MTAERVLWALYDGAHGLVLAAETAIGEHPVQSVDMVVRMLDAFERSTGRVAFDDRWPATPDREKVNDG